MKDDTKPREYYNYLAHYADGAVMESGDHHRVVVSPQPNSSGGVLGGGGGGVLFVQPRKWYQNPVFVWSVIINVLISLAVVSTVLEATPEISGQVGYRNWQIIDGVLSTCFAFDYFTRLYLSNHFGNSRWYFMTRPLNICDLLAILPFFINWLVWRNPFSDVLRVARVIRLFRIVKHSVLGRLLMKTFERSETALHILVLCLLVLGVFLGAFIYSADRLWCPDFEDQ